MPWTPPAPATIQGAVLPSIVYTGAGNAQVTLDFLRAPRKVDPLAPAPIGADAVASDGTLWSTSWFVEAYVQMTVTVFLGNDLDNWLNFLTYAVNGQVMTFYPNQADTSLSAQCRLIVQGRENSSNSNVPRGDPTPKFVGPGRFEVQMVLRLEDPTQASAVYNKLVGLT